MDCWRNRDTGIENKYVDTKGARTGGMNWEIGIDIYMPYKVGD